MAIKGLLERFKKGLARTAQLFNIRAWFGRKVDQSFLDDLEARLIQADVGVVATGRIIDRVREAYADKTADENLVAFVKEELKSLLEEPNPGVLAVAAEKPSVYLIAGVNGSGKTTSIAKLAQRLKDQGQSIVLGACDTFRAAAADQLEIWAKRAGCEIVRAPPGPTRPALPTTPASAPGPRHRCPDRGHRRPLTHSNPPHARARKDQERDSAAHPRRAPRGAAGSRRHQRPECNSPGRSLHEEHRLYRRDPDQARWHRQGRRRRRRPPDHEAADQIHRRRRSPRRSPTFRRRYLRRIALRLSRNPPEETLAALPPTAATCGMVQTRAAKLLRDEAESMVPNIDLEQVRKLAGWGLTQNARASIGGWRPARFKARLHLGPAWLDAAQIRRNSALYWTDVR